MLELMKILLPTDPFSALLWVIILLIIIKNTSRFETKWFSLEFIKSKLNRNSGEQSELIVRDRILKDFKIIKSTVRTERDRIIIYYKSIFRDLYISFLESKCKADTTLNFCISLEQNPSLKSYLILFDMVSKTTANTIFIDMVFRNGFPKIRGFDKDSVECSSAIKDFEEVTKDKAITIIRTIDSYIEQQWFDDTTSCIEYSRYMESFCNSSFNKLYKETFIFFRNTIEVRDEFIDRIFKDFTSFFKTRDECQRYCELYFRELYE